MSETQVQTENKQEVKETPKVNHVNPTDGYVYMEDVREILDIAMVTGENIVLYGNGGYGKSTFCIDYLAEKNIKPYVITMGSGMTIDRLFGGLNIPVFNSTGKIEYLVENSFMEHEYVIFEELFDAPDFILEQLKDILSSGVFRNGSQEVPIKTKLIIGCTNKTREDYAKNTSLKALMERFPMELKVTWKDHNKIAYEHLLKTKLGWADPMLTYILEQFAIAGNIISPRVAIKAANAIDKYGVKAINFFADFNNKKDILKAAITKFESLIEMSAIINMLKEAAEEFKTFDTNSLQGIKDATKTNKRIGEALSKLNNIKVDDTMINDKSNAYKKYLEVYNRNKKEMDIIMQVDDIDTEAIQEDVQHAADTVTEDSHPF